MKARTKLPSPPFHYSTIPVVQSTVYTLPPSKSCGVDKYIYDTPYRASRRIFHYLAIEKFWHRKCKPKGRHMLMKIPPLHSMANR